MTIAFITCLVLLATRSTPTFAGEWWEEPADTVVVASGALDLGAILAHRLAENEDERACVDSPECGLTFVSQTIRRQELDRDKMESKQAFRSRADGADAMVKGRFARAFPKPLVIDVIFPGSGGDFRDFMTQLRSRSRMGGGGKWYEFGNDRSVLALPFTMRTLDVCLWKRSQETDWHYAVHSGEQANGVDAHPPCGSILFGYLWSYSSAGASVGASPSVPCVYLNICSKDEAAWRALADWSEGLGELRLRMAIGLADDEPSLVETRRNLRGNIERMSSTSSVTYTARYWLVADLVGAHLTSDSEGGYAAHLRPQQSALTRPKRWLIGVTDAARGIGR